MFTFHRLNKEIGMRMLEKYKYTCQLCGNKKTLIVHHIERKAVGTIDYSDEKNLTVVCKSCHMSLHRKAGHILTRGGRRGNNPPILCKEQGCEKLQHGRGLCKKHYEFKRRHGQL